MNRWLKIIFFGFITWAIPFITAIPLMSLMTSDPALFKTIMVVTGGLTGMALTVYYFKDIKEQHLRQGIIVGVAWLIINWLLDILILLPLSKQPILRYFLEIGLEYSNIPIMTIGTGYLLQTIKKSRK